jgi:cell division protein ZapA
MASDSDNFQVEPRPVFPTRKVVMAHVTVTINGRQYRMACEDGQESHLERLASDLDRHVEQLRGSFGEIGDNRLLVMAALTISDELNEAKQNIRRLETELAGHQEARVVSADRSQATQAAVAAALNAAAERIERVTKSLNQSIGGSVVLG